MKYDCIIIGAGPAGISAAIYLQRAGRKIVIIEKEYPGGRLNSISNIENYLGYSSISGSDLSMNLYKQLEYLKIEVIMEEALSIENDNDIKIVHTAKNDYKSDFIILAFGRQTKKLELDDEKELEGRGISYCAVCDGPLYKDREVVVIGGGVSALREAMYLSSFCTKVTIINKNDVFKANKEEIEQVEKIKNIKIMYNARVEKYNKKDNVLTSITVLLNGKEKEIKADGCFVFIGSKAQSNLLKDLVTDENGYILCNENMETSISHIYACGDNVKKQVYQIVTAASEGAIAALSIIKQTKRG